MHGILPTLTIKDVKQVLGISIPTIHRRLKDARKGLDSFPLPIGKRNQKLLWDHYAVLNYLEGSSQALEAPKFESPSKRKKRHNGAMNLLKNEHGLNVKTLRGEDGANW